MTDPKRWKSIAVRTSNYQLLKALCKKKFRTPGAFVEKLITDYITFQANKEKVSEEKYKALLLEDK